MDTVITLVIILAAIVGVGAKLMKDARRFREGAPTDCGCGKGAACNSRSAALQSGAPNTKHRSP